MDINALFDLGKQTKTYRRVDESHKVNVFLGYDTEGYMSLVITENATQRPTKSSQLIKVQLKRRKDGKYALSFALLDDKYKSMFLAFCEDIITSCELVGKEEAISNALLRWQYWKELFGKRATSELDKKTIKGLIGELIVLREHLLVHYSEETAVASWTGPLLSYKDFEVDSTWYEVKTTTSGSNQITISSLEQLDSERLGHLVVVRLDDSNKANLEAISLNDVVQSILDRLSGSTVMDLFASRLISAGYQFSPEYDNTVFEYKGFEMYAVSSEFPKLSRNNVPEAVAEAKYTLVLNALSEYKESTDDSSGVS